jgi:hypothetical protein
VLDRLAHQETIEGIAVMELEIRKMGNRCFVDRQRLDPVFLPLNC